ncbi:MAG: PilZ domain-containing protein [Lachnospiraceae bacterium]|nr:PilZ domain-containing protein [Lachnospiraceae bacterium]
MEFHEISVRSKVVITVTNGSDVQAKFLSKVMKNGETYLLVIPFMYNGMRIRFEGKKMSIHMEVRDAEGVLWTFRNCKIDTIRKNGLKYHKIECAMKKGIENRRGGRRFYIWEPTTFQIEGLEKPAICHLKDIGVEGFSFAMDIRNPELMDGTKVTCHYKDKSGIEIATTGKIVRKEKLDHYHVYGCHLLEHDLELERFVKKLERRMIVTGVELDSMM